MISDGKLRYALVGAGTIARNHLEALAKLSDRVEIAAIADLREDAAAAYAQQHGIGRTFTDYQRMIDDVQPDVVVVCVPPMLHEPVARYALERGCHVYCEKPFAATVAQGRALQALAKRHDRLATVNHQRRCTPRYQLVRQVLESNRIGKLHRASLYCSFRFRSLAYYKHDWRGRATWAGACGGVLLNQCIHELDILLWAFRMPRSVIGYCRTHNSELEVEDDVYAILEFGDDAAGMLHASVIDEPGRNMFEFVGDRGKLEVTTDEIRLTTLEPSIPEFHRTWDKQYGRPASTTQVLDEPVLPEGATEFDAMHANLLDVLTGRQPASSLIVPPEQTTMALEVTNAIYLSSAQRRPITLPMDDAAYEQWFAQRADVTTTAASA
ncbi:MAG: Gfo/Idh/MocA family protein [Phycisphaeraceae bacterium]